MADPTQAALMLNLQLSIANSERWQLVRIAKRHPAIRNMVVKLARQAQIGGTWPVPTTPFGVVPQGTDIPIEGDPLIIADEESFDDDPPSPGEHHKGHRSPKATKGKH